STTKARRSNGSALISPRGTLVVALSNSGWVKWSPKLGPERGSMGGGTIQAETSFDNRTWAPRHLPKLSIFCASRFARKSGGMTPEANVSSTEMDRTAATFVSSISMEHEGRTYKLLAILLVALSSMYVMSSLKM